MILVNGDSITYGQGLENNLDSWPNLIFENVKNIAEPGSSNFSIYRRTVEELLRFQYNHVLIGWTGLYRLEIGDTYSKPKTIHPLHAKNNLEKEIVTNWLGEFWYFKNFLFLLYQLSLICKNCNVSLTCINFGQDLAETFDKVTVYKNFKKFFCLNFYSDNEIRHEFIVINKMINLTKKHWIMPMNMDLKCVYLKHNQQISKTDYHPNSSGHKLIAEKIKSALYSKSILL
jgi:hypothetical protein